MNKALLSKLYCEATTDSNDLVDQGRKELALDLLKDCNSFLRDYYPDYWTSKDIACIDDLEQVIFDTDEAGSHARMLSINLGYRNCFTWLIKDVSRAIEIASENKLKGERREPSHGEIIKHIEDNGFGGEAMQLDGNPTPEAYEEARQELIQKFIQI